MDEKDFKTTDCKHVYVTEYIIQLWHEYAADGSVLRQEKHKEQIICFYCKTPETLSR